MWLALGQYRGPSKAHALLAYVEALQGARREERSYRVYVTDSLRLQPAGKYLETRWADLGRPREEIDVDRTIDQVVSRLGGDRP